MSQQSHIVVRVTPVVAIFLSIAAMAFVQLPGLASALALIFAVAALVTSLAAVSNYRRDRLNRALAVGSTVVGFASLVVVLGVIVPMIVAYTPR